MQDFSLRRHLSMALSTWWMWATLSTLSVVLTVVICAIDISEHKSLLKNESLLVALNSAPLPQSAVTATQVAEDFTRNLPVRPDVPAVLSVLQRSAAAAGVTLQEIRVEERKSSIRELGLAQLTLQLRGTYPNIKQVLIDLQGHFAALTVRHLDLHRSAPPSVEAEGTATLAIWARPLTPPPTSSPRDPRLPGSS